MSRWLWLLAIVGQLSLVTVRAAAAPRPAWRE